LEWPPGLFADEDFDVDFWPTLAVKGDPIQKSPSGGKVGLKIGHRIFRLAVASPEMLPLEQASNSSCVDANGADVIADADENDRMPSLGAETVPYTRCSTVGLTSFST